MAELTREQRIERLTRIQALMQRSTPNLEPKATSPLVSALDYLRATTTGPALAHGLEALTGKDVYKEGEWTKALKLGGFPSSAELLNRAEVLKDYPKTRMGAGFALDLATDPSTYALPLGKLAGRAAPALGDAVRIGLAPGQEALRAGAESVGRSTWKSAFKPLDIKAQEFGKAGDILPSQILMQEGVAAPTSRGVLNKMSGVAGKYLDARDAALDAATTMGSKVDVDTIKKPLEALAAKYEKLPEEGAQEFAKKLRADIADVEALRPRAASGYEKAVEGVSPTTATEAKTFLRKGVPEGRFKEYAQTPLGNERAMAKASGYQAAAEQAVGESLGEDVGKAFKDTNARLGSLLSTVKKQVGEVGKSEMKNAFTSVDAMGLGALGAAHADPKWLLLKKLADLAKMQGPRSLVGKGLVNFGQSELVAPALIQGAKRSAWTLLNNEDQNR